MTKVICLTFILLFVAVATSLRCYTYSCGSKNGISCTLYKNHEYVTCGIAGKGYQTVCSYVAIDDIKTGGYEVETACDLVPLGRLQDVNLKRCVEEDLEGKVVHCNLCQTDLCNTPPRN